MKKKSKKWPRGGTAAGGHGHFSICFTICIDFKKSLYILMYIHIYIYIWIFLDFNRKSYIKCRFVVVLY